MKSIPAWQVQYALDAPTFDCCRQILWDALHGCTGADNVLEVQANYPLPDKYKSPDNADLRVREFPGVGAVAVAYFNLLQL